MQLQNWNITLTSDLSTNIGVLDFTDTKTYLIFMPGTTVTRKYVFAIHGCKRKYGTDITMDYLPLIHLWFSSKNWLPFYTEKLTLRKASSLKNSLDQFLRIECYFFKEYFESIELHKIFQKKPQNFNKDQDVFLNIDKVRKKLGCLQLWLVILPIL